MSAMHSHCVPVPRHAASSRKNVSFHANTSAASIPLALSYVIKNGKIQKGQLIIMDAMGAGFTWGAAAVRI